MLNEDVPVDVVTTWSANAIEVKKIIVDASKKNFVFILSPWR